MRIGFLNNQIDARGTGNAVYNYAHYNEEILGNTSKIFFLPSHAMSNQPDAVHKYIKRFTHLYEFTPENLTDVDLLYHIKSGAPDEVNPDHPDYAVHAVFDAQPHGDRYAVISEWMGLRNNLPFVPHIVDPLSVPEFIEKDLRKFFKIPDDATVFGRIGGWDSFDIPWVWDAIKEVIYARSDVWFLMVNTAPIGFQSDRLIFLPETLNELLKSQFVNTCDAMIHARNRGETFGISVGEFSIKGKPIFTYKNSYEKAHIFELRGTARTYDNQEDLAKQLLEYKGEKSHAFYTRFTPERVMEKFKEVFIDEEES